METSCAYPILNWRRVFVCFRGGGGVGKGGLTFVTKKLIFLRGFLRLL